MTDKHEKIQEIIDKTAADGVEFISYETIKAAFQIGELIDLGEGRTVIAKEVGLDHYNNEFITLKVKCEKGSKFSKNTHDALEEILVIYGHLIETVAHFERVSFEKLTIRNGVPHGFVFLEETLFYSKITKNK